MTGTLRTQVEALISENLEKDGEDRVLAQYLKNSLKSFDAYGPERKRLYGDNLDGPRLHD